MNGHQLGRYWLLKPCSGQCGTSCDYRGPFNNQKCRGSCTAWTQAQYHVPRGKKQLFKFIVGIVIVIVINCCSGYEKVCLIVLYVEWLSDSSDNILVFLEETMLESTPAKLEISLYEVQ